MPRIWSYSHAAKAQFITFTVKHNICGWTSCQYNLAHKPKLKKLNRFKWKNEKRKTEIKVQLYCKTLKKQEA